MDQLEQALKEALVRNADETERWTKYKEENQQAIDSMQHFSQKLSVDVMVPIGTKAFMPGQLYHTNEIFVSHYRGLFSQCSSHQAQDIAKHRIAKAQNHLDSLQKERDMYQNKLDLPYVDGAMATGEEREIIEEYDEEKEKMWRVEHKRKVREAKLNESKEVCMEQNDSKKTDDVMKLLDDLEIMEELEEELDQLQIEDDAMLQQMMAGEIQPPPEKPRISYCANKNVIPADESNSNTRETSIVDEIANKYENLNINCLESGKSIDFTNNNSIPNVSDYDTDSTSSDTLSTDEIPDRILEIEVQAKYLKTGDKIKLFKKHLKEVENYLKETVVKTNDELEEKIAQLEFRDYLMDHIIILKDELIDETYKKEMKNNDNETNQEEKTDKKKKHITFAPRNEVQIIDKNEAANNVVRAKIELSDHTYTKSNGSNESSTVLADEIPVVDKQKLILEKVERCREFVSANQSQNDFDLLGKIINSVESKNHTLSIEFKHSENHFTYPGYEVSNVAAQEEIIGSPADIYRHFHTRFSPDKQIISSTDIYDRGDHVGIKTAVIVKDVSQPIEENKAIATKVVSSEPVKSILKNKEMIQSETINEDVVKKPEKRNHSVQERIGFASIMGDVIENGSTPDPLPSEKFIDVYAPKKRISRFKQMRANS